MGKKKKTSIYIDEDLWRKWLISAIENFNSSRKASEMLENLMWGCYKSTWVQDIPEEKAEEYIARSEALYPKLIYETGLSKSGDEGKIGMYYRLRPGVSP